MSVVTSRVEDMIGTTSKQITGGDTSPLVLEPGEVDSMLEKVATGALPTDDATRIDVLRGLERLKCAVEGAQAAIAVGFDASQRQVAADRGARREKQGHGIGHQIALARRESPQKGHQHLGLAKVLTTEMPHTMRALRGGHITEWRATILARETACLDAEHRREIDEALGRCGPSECDGRPRNGASGRQVGLSSRPRVRCRASSSG
jgi:hypothetical protein